MRSIPTLAFLAAFVAGTATAQSPIVNDAVREFDAYVAQGVADWQVPGLSVAVVRNDSVLFARGYGLRAIGEHGAVDEHTLFGIMSTTKAFTAAAIAMLVDDGKLEWSDPVMRWLPELQFPQPIPTAQITVKDLLTHNTGLDYADLLWVRGDLDDGEILRRVRHLRPGYSLRSSFIYQNVMYGAAGEVIARASGMSYPEFLRTRIFAPLGMTRTYPTSAAASEAADANSSRAHLRIRDTIRVIAEERVDVLPAAGSIWSTTSDMARWARFLLDSAQVDGTRLISAQNFAQLFQPHALVPADEFYPSMALTRPRWTSYGLGWFQQDYNGRYLAFHTGSLSGRTAIIGLVPDARMAVIVLGNLDRGELRHALMLRAVDVFAGTNGAPARDWSAELRELYTGLERRSDSTRAANDAKRIAGTRPSLPLSAYAGTYEHPAWGSFVIMERNGRLYGTNGVGPQNTGPLQHWHYDTFRASFGDQDARPFMIQFVLGTDGAVKRLLAGGRDEYAYERAP